MEHFCIAPWTHTYVSPQGERRLCCASRESSTFQRQYIDAEGDPSTSSFDPSTLDEHWNSPYMMDIRKRILAGEKIDQCQVCNDQILNLHTYRKYFTETLFPHKIQEAIDSTDADGRTSMFPISYDYRISNKCNFKCRMCGEQLSSSWEAEKRKHNKINKNDRWMDPTVRKLIYTFEKEVLEVELQQAVDEQRIEEIYWVGGEPLMWDLHWDIIKQLVESGQSKEVALRYNTNLSRIDNLYDYLPYFKNINLCASIDAVGDVGEYIRSGLVWKHWLDNFKRGMFLNDLYGDDAMVLDVTLTTPGIFVLDSMFDLALELGVKTYLKTTFAFDASVLMCPLALPRQSFDDVIDNQLEYMRPRVTQKTQVYVDTLEHLKQRQTFEEQYDDVAEKFRIGKERVEFLDQIRQDEHPGKFRDMLRSQTALNWFDSGWE